MSLEIWIYLLLASACFVWRRILSGLDNAVFYAKGKYKPNGKGEIGKTDHPEPKKFERLVGRYMANIHFIETPSWYAQAGIFFFPILAILRLALPGGFWMIVLVVAISIIWTMCLSGIANPFYQGLINLSVGRKYIDPTELAETEFAFNIFGKEISIWRWRGFRGAGRVWMAIGSFFILMATLFFVYKKANDEGGIQGNKR